jgi:MoxR-like ATPase
VSGVSIFDPSKKEFKLHKGPVFTNILLADEINRASPRTQSALLEAMAESQVSIDGTRFSLDHLFFVIATQNPVESRGTYPLPEAQMDRFSMKLTLGYVSAEDEVSILTDQEKQEPVESIKPCVSLDEIIRLKKEASDIFISHELKHYIVSLVRQTREYKGVTLGAGHRASITLMKSAKAMSLFKGQDYVTPEIIQELAEWVIPHRMLLDPEFMFSGNTAKSIVHDIINETDVPA